MQPNHLPALGARYWSALCLASIFGANMGDLFARNLGLGHVAGFSSAKVFQGQDRRPGALVCGASLFLKLGNQGIDGKARAIFRPCECYQWAHRADIAHSF